ncbi:MAG: O-methyltransferase [Ignavibacteriaceae bacterium]
MTQIFYPVQKRYLESFKRTENKLLKEIEEYASENNVPILDWHAAEFMEKLIKIHKPDKVLEIGTAIGYTTIRIAECLGKSATIQTIEKSKDNILIAEENFEKSGLNKKIKLIEGNALNILPQIGKKFDFIFLDADKEDYKRLFDYSMLLLKKGGLIVIDNLLWHGHVASTKVPAKYSRSTKHIRDFNKLFILQQNLDSMIIPIGDGLGLGVKK